MTCICTCVYSSDNSVCAQRGSKGLQCSSSGCTHSPWFQTTGNKHVCVCTQSCICHWTVCSAEVTISSILQIAKTYDIPPEMIKNVFKKTKKGFVITYQNKQTVHFYFPSLPLPSPHPFSRLLVHFSAEMISRFEDEDDFIIELPFDNQKGCFDLYVRYWPLLPLHYIIR